MLNMSEIRRPGIDLTQDRLRKEMTYVELPNQWPEKKLKINWKQLLIAVILLIIVITGVYLIFLRQGKSYQSEWQAVFISNGQIYFGKIAADTDREVILKNVYYLKNVNELQQDKDIGIIKLGNEFPGAMDEIRINRIHILYIEDLKADSKVVQAIKSYVGPK